MRLCGFSSRFQLLFPCMRQVTHALLTRPPLDRISASTVLLSFDLHVLSTPPAFILSQDQTLHCNNIFSNYSVDNLLKDSKSININIDGSCFSVHHIYITYGAPACTTCLFILNLSKNSHLCFAIVSESGCKGKRFYRNRQMFRKFF